MGVPHPEEGIALPLHQMLTVDPGPVVRGGMQQGPAGGVGAEREGIGGRGNGTDDGAVLVVEVHDGALGPKDPAESLGLDDGPRLTDRTEPDGVAAQGVTVPVPGTTPQDLVDEPAVPGVGKADVDEPGPGDDDVTDAAGAQKLRP
jgi:hypothetical protein